MTHSYVTWRIHMRHDAFIRDMTHSYVKWLVTTSHDKFICNMTQADIIHHHFHQCLIIVCSESQRNYYCHVCNTPHSLHRLCKCVCLWNCIYTHIHCRRLTSWHTNAHKRPHTNVITHTLSLYLSLTHIHIHVHTHTHTHTPTHAHTHTHTRIHTLSPSHTHKHTQTAPIP